MTSACLFCASEHLANPNPDQSPGHSMPLVKAFKAIWKHLLQIPCDPYEKASGFNTLSCCPSCQDKVDQVIRFQTEVEVLRLKIGHVIEEIGEIVKVTLPNCPNTFAGSGDEMLLMEEFHRTVRQNYQSGLLPSTTVHLKVIKAEPAFYIISEVDEEAPSLEDLELMDEEARKAENNSTEATRSDLEMRDIIGNRTHSPTNPDQQTRVENSEMNQSKEDEMDIYNLEIKSAPDKDQARPDIDTIMACRICCFKISTNTDLDEKTMESAILSHIISMHSKEIQDTHVILKRRERSENINEENMSVKNVRRKGRSPALNRRGTGNSPSNSASANIVQRPRSDENATESDNASSTYSDEDSDWNLPSYYLYANSMPKRPTGSEGRKKEKYGRHKNRGGSRGRKQETSESVIQNKRARSLNGGNYHNISIRSTSESEGQRKEKYSEHNPVNDSERGRSSIPRDFVRKNKMKRSRRYGHCHNVRNWRGQFQKKENHMEPTVVNNSEQTSQTPTRKEKSVTPSGVIVGAQKRGRSKRVKLLKTRKILITKTEKAKRVRSARSPKPRLQLGLRSGNHENPECERMETEFLTEPGDELIPSSLQDSEVELSKRPKGRPRKIRSPDEIEQQSKPKRPRGRPHKILSPAEVERRLIVQNLPKRSRGRPSKNRSTSSELQETTEIEVNSRFRRQSPEGKLVEHNAKIINDSKMLKVRDHYQESGGNVPLDLTCNSEREQRLSNLAINSKAANDDDKLPCVDRLVNWMVSQPPLRVISGSGVLM